MNIKYMAPTLTLFLIGSLCSMSPTIALAKTSTNALKSLNLVYYIGGGSKTNSFTMSALAFDNNALDSLTFIENSSAASKVSPATVSSRTTINNAFTYGNLLGPISSAHGKVTLTFSASVQTQAANKDTSSPASVSGTYTLDFADGQLTATSPQIFFSNDNPNAFCEAGVIPVTSSNPTAAVSFDCSYI